MDSHEIHNSVPRYTRTARVIIPAMLTSISSIISRQHPIEVVLQHSRPQQVDHKSVSQIIIIPGCNRRYDLKSTQ